MNGKSAMFFVGIILTIIIQTTFDIKLTELSNYIIYYGVQKPVIKVMCNTDLYKTIDKTKEDCFKREKIIDDYIVEVGRQIDIRRNSKNVMKENTAISKRNKEYDYTYKDELVFVDLVDVLADEDIIFKENNRKYLINKDAWGYKIKNVLVDLSKEMSITITETTEGAHDSSIKYSHYNGYKIDVRTRDLSVDNIIKMLTKLNDAGFMSVFEYENTVDGVVRANEVRKSGFTIQESSGEHIDINLAIIE